MVNLHIQCLLRSEILRILVTQTLNCEEIDMIKVIKYLLTLLSSFFNRYLQYCLTCCWLFWFSSCSRERVCVTNILKISLLKWHWMCKLTIIVGVFILHLGYLFRWTHKRSCVYTSHRLDRENSSIPPRPFILCCVWYSVQS
jgi:hypothetical protein